MNVVKVKIYEFDYISFILIYIEINMYLYFFSQPKHVFIFRNLESSKTQNMNT